MKKISYIVIAVSLFLSSGCGDTFYEVYNRFTGPVDSVSIKTNTSIVVDQTEQLYATVYPSMADNKNVTWMSDDPLIASVDENGLVTAHMKDGQYLTTIITVITEDGQKTAMCAVTVSPVPIPIESLTIPATFEFGVGQPGIIPIDIVPANATDSEITWSSSDSAIVTVDANGNVMGGTLGTATITARSEHWNITATCLVTVGEPTYSVTYTAADSTGGEVPVDTNRYKAGSTLTVAARGTIERQGYSFRNWSSGGSYYPEGASCTMPGSDIVFSAEWNLLPPAIPEGVVVTPGNTSITISWSAVAGADSYDAYYSTTNNSATAAYYSYNTTSQTYLTISGLVNETVYYVWVKASNAVAKSDFSAVSSGKPASYATVATGTVSGITLNSAVIAGEVTDTGGTPVTSKGVCWSRNSNPTIDDVNDFKSASGSGTGSFTCNLTDLNVFTTYYARAYATNSTGTAYGSEQVFRTLDYQLGDTGPGGGKIFYIYNISFPLRTKVRLEAAPYQWYYYNHTFIEPETAWSTITNGLSGAKGTEVGTGPENTGKIITQNNNAASAAKLCRDYRGGGKSDWFLPSIDELDKLFLNKSYIGGYAAGVYWSSSEVTATTVYSDDFSVRYWDPGAILKGGFKTSAYVRPIRKF